MKNYLNFETDIKELETEIEKIEELEDNVLGKLKELESEVDELNKKIQ